jgi:predicted nucleotidyltransferase
VDEDLGIFSPDEQRTAVEGVAEALGPLGIRVMVLGRVAMLYLFDMGRASKDVDIHPFPMKANDLIEVHETLEAAVQEGGGRVRWEPDGRSMTVHFPIEDREIPVEIVLGGEDWISPEVLKDAVSTGTSIEGVMVPSPEHLLAMKAEAYFDRRAEPGVERFRDDMVDIVSGASDLDVSLDLDEVRRLVLMRPERKRTVMLDLCASVLP